MEINLNTLDLEEFGAYLAARNYNEIEALYGTLDNRHEAKRLQWCANALKEFLERKDQLHNITEIRDYVRELPIWQRRQVEINRQVDELRAKI